MAVIWVTGAAGFAGQHLIEWLAKNKPAAKIVQVGSHTEQPIDLTDFDSVLALAEESAPDEVYHLAGRMPPAGADTMWSSFVRTTYNLMRALHESGRTSARVLIVGSAAEYLPASGEPIPESHPVGGRSPYGIAKAAQSMLALECARSFGISLVIARTFNLIGPGMSRHFVLGEICGQLADGTQELTLGNIESERDFIDIRDAVAAYGKLMGSEVSGEAVNVCTGKAVSIREMIELAVTASGDDVSIKSESDRMRAHDFDRVIGDPSRLKSATGWESEVSLAQSVADVIETFR